MTLPGEIELISIREAANILAVSTKTLRRWEKQGTLVSQRTKGNHRRYLKSEVESLLKSRTTVTNESPALPFSQSPDLANNFSYNVNYVKELRDFFQGSGVLKKGVIIGVFFFAAVLGFGKFLLNTNFVSHLSLGNKSEKTIAQKQKTTAVLGETASPANYVFRVNIPGKFYENSEFLKDVTIDGKLIAPNLINGITAGSGMSVGTGQNPVITNKGVLSLGGKTGEVSLTAGTGISISGLTISNSDLGSSQNIFKTITAGGTSFSAGSNSDTLTFSNGSGISFSTDTSNKKITISSSISNSTINSASGWTQSGNYVTLTTSTNYVGIGTSTPTVALDIAGSASLAGQLTFENGYGTIQTTANQGLTMGGSTTGSIYLMPLNGSGYVGVNTTSPSKTLDVTGTLGVSGATSLSSTLNVLGATTIAPSSDGITSSLTVKAGVGSTGNILNITNSSGSTSYLSIDTNGSLTVGGSTLTNAGILESSGAIHLSNSANTIVGTAILGGWTMNSNTYTYRRTITITNTSGSTLPKNYQITVNLSSSASNQVYTNSQTASPYKDFRAAWDNTGSITEIARNVSSFTSSNVSFSFQLQANIAASGTDTYYLYYSNSALSSISASYSSYTGDTQLDSADSLTNWATGESTNYAMTLENTIKQEGTGSVKTAGFAGNLSTLSTSSQNQLPQVLKNPAAVATTISGTNYIYVLGGNNDTSDQTTAYKSTIDASGNTGAFSTTSQGQLPQVLSGHAALAITPTIDYGTGTDGTLDLSLGSGAGGCNGTGLQWSNGNTCAITSATKATFNFTTINIPSGKILVATGTAMVTLKATGAVTVGGTINLNGRGYGSGLGTGAGGTGQNWDPDFGGGGGGGFGGTGGVGGNGAIGGSAGVSYDTLSVGSGGGPYSGGAGGGGIRISATGNITISGTINANGANGANSSSGAGGGGSGGKILLESQGSVTNTGSITATGGSGGTGYYSFSTTGGGGGGGGGGRITLSGSSVTAGTTNVSGGAGGGPSQVQAGNGNPGVLTTTSTTPSVYVLGGINGSTRQATVYKSTLTSANLGTFSTTSQGQLPVALNNLSANSVTISNTNYMYVLGGNNGTSDVSTVYKATVDGSGNIGAFATTGQGQLLQNLSLHSSQIVTISGTSYIYVIGGLNGSTAQSTVYKATIDASGNIGTFSTVSQTQLPAAIYNASSFTTTIGTTNYIYLVGGKNAAGNPVNFIYRGKLDASGNVSSWTLGNTLPQALSSSTSVTATNNGSNNVYVLGGANPSAVATVYKSLINDMSTYTLTKTLSSAVDLTNKNNIQFGYYSSLTGGFNTFEFSKDNTTWTQCANSTDFTSGAFTVNSANTWETKTCDISSVSSSLKNAVLYFRTKVSTTQTVDFTTYIDNVQGLTNAATISNTSSLASAVLGAANLNVNAQGSGAVNINYDATNGLAGTGGLAVYNGSASALMNVNSNGMTLSVGSIYDGFWQRINGAISPINITDDFLLGSSSTSSAQFSVSGIAKNQAVASISGQLIVMSNNGWGGQVGIGYANPGIASLAVNGNVGIGTTSPVAPLHIAGAYGSNAALIVNQLNSGDLFVASASGTTRLTLSNGGNLNLIGGVYQSGGVSGVTVASASCITSTGGIVTGSGACPGSSTSLYWNQTSGALFPNNSTVDLLIGGQSTTSAKFAIINVNGTRGAQTASLSGSLTLDSTTASVQSVKNQLLTLGGNTTGNILLSPNNGGGDILFGSTPLSTQDNSVLYTGLSGKLLAATTTSSGLCLKSNGTGSAPTWGTCSTVQTGQQAIGASVYPSAQQTIANVTFTNVNWDTESYDTNGFHDNSINNDRFTIPAGFGGKYLLTANATWVSNSVGERILVFTKNGSQAGGWVRALNGSSEALGQSTTFVLDLSPGDYVGVQVYQTSGGNLNLHESAGTPQRSSFTITKLDSGTDDWQLSNGALFPIYASTVDFLLGSQSTSSAKFSFTGLSTGQTLASISGELSLMPNNGWGGGLGIGTNNFGGSSGSVIALANTGTAPSAVANQGFLYVSNGALQYRGPTTLTQIAAADYAEAMPSKEVLSAGEIVSASSDIKNDADIYNNYLIESAKIPYDSKIIGIVSSFNQSANSSSSALVTLVGRVPVKVTTENGNISVGDSITSSSLPGVGMKATQAGMVAGKALQAYNNSDKTAVGQILVLVNVGWYDSGSQITFPYNPTASISASFASLDSLAGIQNATVSGSLMVLGRATVKDLGVTGTINSGLLVVNGLNTISGKAASTVNTLSGDLYLQNEGLGGINMLSGKVVFDKNGNVNLSGVLSAQTIEAEQYVIKGQGSVGTGTIPAGATKVIINASSAASLSKVIVTPTTLISVPLSVTSKTQGSFTVEIVTGQSVPVNFDWWIIQAK